MRNDVISAFHNLAGFVPDHLDPLLGTASGEEIGFAVGGLSPSISTILEKQIAQFSLSRFYADSKLSFALQRRPTLEQ